MHLIPCYIFQPNLAAAEDSSLVGVLWTMNTLWSVAHFWLIFKENRCPQRSRCWPDSSQLFLLNTLAFLTRELWEYMSYWQKRVIRAQLFHLCISKPICFFSLFLRDKQTWLIGSLEVENISLWRVGQCMDLGYTKSKCLYLQLDFRNSFELKGYSEFQNIYLYLHCAYRLYI